MLVVCSRSLTMEEEQANSIRTISPEWDRKEEEVTVKEEPKDDIKDYAETTMNELLGWYGYDQVVDFQDTQNLDLERFGNADGASAAMLLRMRRERESLDSSGSEDSNGGTGGKKSAENSKKGQFVNCSWCQKAGVKLFTLKTSNGAKAFCSELCFTQCRRASFKKNKVCDWCKHVRHTVNYVDFQDGESQLQFCSDKCLNQYKMNIFCKETQEHLKKLKNDSEPDSDNGVNNEKILITPDLWLLNNNRNKKLKENDSTQNKDEEIPLDLQTKSDAKSPVSETQTAVKPRQEKIPGSNTAPAKISSLTISDLLNSLPEKRIKLEKEHVKEHLKDREREREQEKERLRRYRARETSSTPLSSSSLPLPTDTGQSSPALPSSALQQNIPLLTSLNPGLLSHHPLILQNLIAGGFLPPPLAIQVPETATAPNQQNNKSQENTSPKSSGTNRTPGPMPLPSPLLAPRPQLPHLFPPFPPFPPMPGAFPSGLLPTPPVGPHLPPATLMIPYPVIVPLPIPLPIPIPFKSDQSLQDLLKKCSSREESPSSSSYGENSLSPPATTSSKSSVVEHKQVSPPIPADGKRYSQCKKSKERRKTDSDVEEIQHEVIACACCQSEAKQEPCDGKKENLIHERKRKASSCESEPVLRHEFIPHTPIAALEPATDNNHAIDLSKDKHCSPINIVKTEIRSENLDEGVNKSLTPMMIVPSTSPSYSENSRSPHVADTKQIIPLDNKYSARRGLILDAPSVPKDRSLSPGPEKRLLLRSPSKEMLFGKRRCIRTRIKTK